MKYFRFSFVIWFLIFISFPLFYFFLVQYPTPTNLWELKHWSSIEKIFFFEIRIPKLITSYLIGAGLSLAGVVTQGLFRNPIASPDLLGVSSGAILGILLGLLWGLDQEISFWYYLVTSTSSIIIMLLFFGIANLLKDHTIFILIGFAISLFLNSLSTVISTTQIHDFNLQLKLSEWLLGSLEGKTWEHVYLLLGTFVTCSFLTLFIIKDLDLLILGEDVANTSGANPKKYYFIAILTIGILTGVITGTVGIIGLLGLIIPHLTRLILGSSNHIQLVITSCLLGGVIMVIIDMISRSFQNIYIPPGSITNLIGFPLFIYLLIKNYIFQKKQV